MCPLFNYTTEVSAAKTVAEITAILVKHHAKSILTDYDGSGNAIALAFKIDTPQGCVPIRLPVNPDAIISVLTQQNLGYRYRTHERATMIAWRILKAWVQAQMAILETEMVSLDQVFLPYMLNKNGKTLYEVAKEKGFLQLGTGGK